MNFVRAFTTASRPAVRPSRADVGASAAGQRRLSGVRGGRVLAGHFLRGRHPADPGHDGLELGLGASPLVGSPEPVVAVQVPNPIEHLVDEGAKDEVRPPLARFRLVLARHALPGVRRERGAFSRPGRAIYYRAGRGTSGEIRVAAEGVPSSRVPSSYSTRRSPAGSRGPSGPGPPCALPPWPPSDTCRSRWRARSRSTPPGRG